MDNYHFNYDSWRNRILELRDQKTQKESQEFWELVDRVSGMDGIEDNEDIARTLFQTFTGKPDHEVKEAVVNALNSFSVKTYYRAYLEELPRLIKETRKTGWFSLMADYPARKMEEHDADIVIALVKAMPKATQKAFIEIISDEEFLDDHDWAGYALKNLGKAKKLKSKKSEETEEADLAQLLAEYGQDINTILAEGEAAMDMFPYDMAEAHYECEDYPADLPESAAGTHIGMYLGWAIERGLISDRLKINCKKRISDFIKGTIMPSYILRACCGNELTVECLNDRGNAFTKKYYRPGWKYYYFADFDALAREAGASYYAGYADSQKNYERVRSMIDKRYQVWQKADE